jgi:hypothetical protein
VTGVIVGCQCTENFLCISVWENFTALMMEEIRVD